MKKIIIHCLLLCFVTCSSDFLWGSALKKSLIRDKSEYAIQPDTLISDLSSINLAQFIGLPVDSLLLHLPPGYQMMKIGGWRSQRLAEVLYVLYPNKVYVGIHVRSFQYMNPQLVDGPNPKQNWDINLFKQELISFTVVYNDTICINGCEYRLK